ncbi:phage tail protein [Burkholderia gladioli]|uniref:phage tail protein n=1 Tax=Burkholderia gladioli TaxID=28095 RepID=UPI0016414A87|nr:phage tail protein [Burkholderia gladioli]
MAAIITITDIGRAALVAPGNTGTQARRIVEVGLANAVFAPDKGLKAMPGEFKRTESIGGRNIAPDTIHITINDSSADQYTLFGFGLYLDDGTLFAVYCQDTPILEKSPVAQLLLSADIQFPSIDTATITVGDASFSNPPASTENAGVVELATREEVWAGQDDTRAITPLRAAQRYMSFDGGAFDGPVAVQASVAAGSAQWLVSPAPGALGQEGKIRLAATFSDPQVSDGSPRLVGSIRAGFDHGTWGREYLDVWLNIKPNDARDDANMSRALRLVCGGRALVGDVQDDGESALQVGGNASVRGGVVSSQLDAGGGNFRAAMGDYGAFMRNDGTNVYWLSTKKGDPLGTFNDYRPFTWNLDTGYVTLDASGCGATAGGDLTIVGAARIGTTLGEGHIYLGPRSDGYLYANTTSFGWWYGNAGSVQYRFSDHTLRVDDHAVWHEGNLAPLDRNVGGWIGSDVHFSPGARLVLSDGSASFPSLAFENDGAADTGFYRLRDGAIGITCNAVPNVTFAWDVNYFHVPTAGPTPAAGDSSVLFATTAWVTAAIGTASIGQIVMEPRTSARAGYLKCDGAQYKRSDYPALWAYAQASGALVSEAEFSSGRWGGFSSADGQTYFRVPDLRGEFLRCWSDGRGDVDPGRAIGSFQDSQNQAHTHAASSDTVDDHRHNVWSGANGWHDHGVNQTPHVHATWSGSVQVAGTLPGAGIGPYNGRSSVMWSDESSVNIGIAGNGTHDHAIAMDGAGKHAHVINVQADGGPEARPRNVALLAMIRAY